MASVILEEMEEHEYRERLAHDAATWLRDGLITPEQERAILARSGAGAPQLVTAFRMGWLVSAVSIVGALVLGGGIILLFAANWEEMPDAFRVAVLMGAMCAAYAAGYALTYRFDSDRLGGALLLLGVVLFEANLFLLAQIYNMPVDSPVILLVAAVGIFPVAYAFGSRIVLLVAIANLTYYAIWEIGMRYEESDTFEASFVAIGALGVGLYAVGRLHALRSSLARFGDIYVLAGSLITLALLFAATYRTLWRELIEGGLASYAAPTSLYVALGLAALPVAAAWLLRPRDVESNIESAFLGGLLLLGVVVATWPAWMGYAVVFNVVFFGAAAGFVVRGYMQGDERYINAGLALVAIGLFARYIDIFWSMLGRGAFFVIGGLLLLAAAFTLDRLRRSLLAAIDEDQPGASVLEARPS